MTPSRRPCFLPIQTIFEFNRCIQESNVLTKFYEDWTKNVTSRGSYTIFKHVRDITESNVLTKVHDDWATIVTSRVFTRNTGCHASKVTSKVFTNFKLNQKFTDQTINVARRQFSRQTVDDERRTTDDGQKVIPKAHHEHVVLR
ncbi:hypothetical protein DPMN_067729 [Dreissena polymorpha]|uniref:Uncharacterized protein n=1 Tax=Dreissena polymorpha TaxID=45954 RepID=A0A9D3Z0U7_DREPO|nr:hypothetical protein DPMN_067729 [Dreissena polymorpha]